MAHDQVHQGLLIVNFAESVHPAEGTKVAIRRSGSKDGEKELCHRYSVPATATVLSPHCSSLCILCILYLLCSVFAQSVVFIPSVF